MAGEGPAGSSPSTTLLPRASPARSTDLLVPAPVLLGIAGVRAALPSLCGWAGHTAAPLQPSSAGGSERQAPHQPLPSLQGSARLGRFHVRLPGGRSRSSRAAPAFRKGSSQRKSAGALTRGSTMCWSNSGEPKREPGRLSSGFVSK